MLIIICLLKPYGLYIVTWIVMNCTTFPPHVVTFDCRMSTLHSSKVAKVFKTSPWLLVDNTLTTAWFPKFSTSTCKCCPQILMSYHPNIPLVQVFGDHGTTMIKTLQILKDFMPKKEPCYRTCPFLFFFSLQTLCPN